MGADVKICGITDERALDAAYRGGARYVGFVFVERSPRFLPMKKAADLANSAPEGLTRVGLFADPENRDLAAVLETVPLEVIQLHGHETPDRVREVKSLTGKRVWKAVGIAEEADIALAHGYEDAADSLLFDAKPPKSRPLALQGGNGLVFDWEQIAGEAWKTPWILAGGLDPDNVAEAISTSGAKIVDVSSGVESAPGVKDPGRIEAFLKAAHGAGTKDQGG